jgi:phage shock protein PspC (stress-responsive transcriptional regulator)
MTKIDWKRKLSSRKLWAAVAGIVTGLAMVFGLDEGTISSVAGAVVSVASVVAYIITEGKVDAEGVKNAVEGVQDAVEKVQGTSAAVMKSAAVFDAGRVNVEEAAE